MDIANVLRIIFGGIFVLFVPGFVWSYVFFTRKQIDWIERLALSFGLSIVLVPITVFWLNWLFHMKLTILNTSLVVTALILIAGIIVAARKYNWYSKTMGKIKSFFLRIKQAKR